MLRAHLNDYITTNFEMLPDEVADTIARLDGTVLGAGNFFDSSIDVFDFTYNIETVAQITDRSFQISSDAETLAGYLEAADPQYYAGFLLSEAQLQSAIDNTFENAGAGYSGIRAQFSFAWEFISGFSTAVYESAVAGLGGLKAIADNADNFVKGISVTQVEGVLKASDPSLVLSATKLVEGGALLKSVFEKLAGIGGAVSGSFGGSNPDNWIGVDSPVFQELTELQKDVNDFLKVTASVPDFGPYSIMLDLAALVGQLVNLVDNWFDINSAQADPDLSEVSAKFLADADLLNWYESVDLAANIMTTAVGFFKIGGQLGGGVVAFAELGRTISDALAIRAKAPWLEEIERFEDLTALTSTIAGYQRLLRDALAKADELSEGVWGTDLASVVPEQPVVGRAVLADRFDTDADAAAEKGATLATGQTVSGTIQFNDRAPVRDKADWYEVELEGGANYRFEVSNAAGSDFDLLFYDDRGNLIGEQNDRKSNGGASTIAEGTVMAGGTYFVAVDGRSRQVSYELSLEETSFSNTFVKLFETDGSIETDLSLLPGQTYAGHVNISSPNEVWIKVELEQDQDYSFTYQTTQSRIATGELTLRNALGGIVATNNAYFDGVGQNIAGTAVESGTYFITVEDGTTSGFSDYRLSFDEIASTGVIRELVDAVAGTSTIYTLAPDTIFEGVLNAIGSPRTGGYDDDDNGTAGNAYGDWIKVNLTAGEEYRFTIESDNERADITLYDQFGSIVSYQNARSLPIANAEISGTALRTGTYFLGIDGSAAEGQYRVQYSQEDLAGDIVELEDAAEGIETQYALGEREFFVGTLLRADDDPAPPDDGKGDWVAIEMTAELQYGFRLEGDGRDLGGTLGIYDASGDIINGVRSASSEPATVSMTAPTTGTYYLAVLDVDTSNRYAVSYQENSVTTGVLSIDGIVAQNETITANISDLADIDGLGEFEFQWMIDGEDIGISGLPDFFVRSNYVGSLISVRATHTDGYGNTETITSSARRIGEELGLGLKGGTLTGTGDGNVLEGSSNDDILYGDGIQIATVSDLAGQIFRLYQATLNRLPDTQGHAGWTAQLFEQSQDLLEITNGFVGSREFQNVYGALDDTNFISLLYNNVLDRAPDDAGLAQWKENIDRGLSRAEVVLGFSESAEMKNATRAELNTFLAQRTEANWTDDVYRLYEATLGRAPDLGGLKSWASTLANGASFETIVGGFVNSAEFQRVYGTLDDTGFVTLLYQNVLKRAPDSAGLDNWLISLEDGLSREKVVSGFSQSAEFINATRAEVTDWMRRFAQDDQLESSSGNDHLFGGELADRFVFREFDEGTKTVHDLEPWDTLEFSRFRFDNVSSIKDLMRQDGDSVVFEYDDLEVILKNVSLSALDDAMFAF
ncbi:DUF4214 domain-containing protein [uncultured Sulfitobacter sp.]|uniref:DUF4214 domain-containing protein n=1 Tax=uncultured Sulfitobacter sp. TaxID=191468 RepID=UPI0026142E6D|nr:DUF4214 domain-containing protein [uncultured Sulfitobacter sp.]